jgi:hypothetical protein
VLRGGIRIEEAFVDWCDEVLTALTPDPTTPTTAPTAPTATTATTANSPTAEKS